MSAALPTLLVALLPQQARAQAVAQPQPANLPTFARQLTLSERAYLGAPLAAVARAVEAAVPCAAGWTLDASRDGKLDLDSPASLVPIDAMLSPDGAMPGKWQVVAICGRGAILLNLAPAIGKDFLDKLHQQTVVDEGPDHLLAQTELLKQPMASLAIWSAAGAGPSASLAAARAVTLFVAGDKLGDPVAILKKVSPAKVLAALAHLPAAPATAACAPEGGALASSAAQVDAAEQDVYRAVLGSELKAGAAQVIVAETSPMTAFTAEQRTQLRAISCVFDSTLESFGQRAVAGLVKTTAATPPSWVLLPIASIAAAFKADGGGWPGFRKAHPGTNGTVAFSRVGFSRDGTQAIVFMNHAWDGLGTEAALYVLQGGPHGWHRLYKAVLWVS